MQVICDLLFRTYRGDQTRMVLSQCALQFGTDSLRVRQIIAHSFRRRLRFQQAAGCGDQVVRISNSCQDQLFLLRIALAQRLGVAEVFLHCALLGPQMAVPSSGMDQQAQLRQIAAELSFKSA